MRLDELLPGDANSDKHDLRKIGCGQLSAYRLDGSYSFFLYIGGDMETWEELDPFTAQAVLFELCSRSDP